MEHPLPQHDYDTFGMCESPPHLCTTTPQHDYDTFGSTAAELALAAARRDADDRPNIIPGGIIEEVLVPVANSIGGRGLGVPSLPPLPSTSCFPHLSPQRY